MTKKIKNRKGKFTIFALALSAMLVFSVSLAFGNLVFNDKAEIRTATVEGELSGANQVFKLDELMNHEPHEIKTQFINTGNSACFMRGTYSIEIENEKGEYLPNSIEIDKDGKTDFVDIIKVNYCDSKDTPLKECEYTELDDGWFYYNRPLSPGNPGESVDSFIESIELADLDFDSEQLAEYKGAKVVVSFQGEFLQFSIQDTQESHKKLLKEGARRYQPFNFSKKNDLNRAVTYRVFDASCQIEDDNRIIWESAK